MHTYLLYSLVGLAAIAAYKVIVIVLTRIQNASRARQLGCQDPPWYPVSGFLGWTHLKQLQAADAKKLFPDFLAERQRVTSEHLGRIVSTFKSYVVGQTVYFTSDPENIKTILATKFQDFELGPVRHAIMGATLGDGIFVQDGKKWEHSRAMLRPNFVREQVSDLDMEERHVQNLFSVMPVKQDGWTDFVDIQTNFFRLTIDAATDFLFGDSVNSQIHEANMSKDSPEAAKSFSVNFDSAQAHMAKKFRLVELHWLHNPKEFQENNKNVNEFIARYVDLALSKPINTSGKEEGGKYVFLEALAQQTRDPVELRAQLLNILLAGRDTTSSLLSWFFHQLLRHPEVFSKLRSTIIQEFGTYEDPKDITFATLKGCQYLQCCLNETNRLWPVVPGNGRRANKNTTLPRGGGPNGDKPVFLAKGSNVDYSIHVMHRRKDLWGEDAEEFRPERFIGRRVGWEYLPFNGGPRICIGQQFALTEAAYVVVRLLQRFDQIEAIPGELENPVVTSNLTLTSCPGRPVTLRLREAKQ